MGFLDCGVQVGPERFQPLRRDDAILAWIGGSIENGLALCFGKHYIQDLPVGSVDDKRFCPRETVPVGVNDERMGNIPLPPLMHFTTADTCTDVNDRLRRGKPLQQIDGARRWTGGCLAFDVGRAHY